MRFVLLLIFFGFVVVPFHEAQAQAPFVFYEIIQGDSVALYFNKDHRFTGKECVDFIRYIRVSEAGDFNGYFEDYDVRGRLHAKGVYRMGIKHGYFELYHSNGKLWSKGYYENNVPVGVWEFFYNTGVRERTLSFEESEGLLMRFVDSSGDERIENGNGKFEIIKMIRGDHLLTVRITGEIVDGKPHGKWRALSLTDASPIYTETFNHGKLIKTSLITRKEMKPSTPSKLGNFFDGNYLTQLEGFYFSSCDQPNTLNTLDPWVNKQILNQLLTKEIDELIEYDIQHRQTGSYIYGENFVTIQFSVNKNGKATDIKLISEWGERFFPAIKNAIIGSSFSTKNETLYFRMRLSYAGGRRYRYNFKFSKHKE